MPVAPNIPSTVACVRDEGRSGTHVNGMFIPDVFCVRDRQSPVELYVTARAEMMTKFFDFVEDRFTRTE